MSRLPISFARIAAVFMKETVQMRRDRLTFAMMLTIPIMQLVIFGFAINMDPKNLPTALYLEENTVFTRTIVKALETSGYYDITIYLDDAQEGQRLLQSGDVAFVVTIPSGFSERLVRDGRPQIAIEADASDPAAASNAIARIDAIIAHALRHDFTGSLSFLQQKPRPYDVIVHPKFNPEGITQHNIVPGLLGIVLTMTLVMATGMAMTREAEQGTIENLLAMPAKPIEVMIGKITPFVVIGTVQTILVLFAALFLFGVPFVGQLWLLLLGVAIFVFANLALGFTFSTIAQSQMQAMQLTFFFLLPSLLLSGFMFPFRGMPQWAQMVGELLPVTHFLRVVRGVMLKGAGLTDLGDELLAMAAFMVIVTIIAMIRYKRTLD